jgi:hypothetical protein
VQTLLPRRGAADGATEPPSTRIVSPAATIERSGPASQKCRTTTGKSGDATASRCALGAAKCARGGGARNPSLALRHIRIKPLANNRVEVRLCCSEPGKIPGKGAGDRLASVCLVKREGRRRVDLEAENFSGGRDFEVDAREG